MGLSDSKHKAKGRDMSTTHEHIETEAAIYAEGTPFTGGELARAYYAHCGDCESQGKDAPNAQRFFEEYIEHADSRIGGDLCDYHTGRYIRRATRVECEASAIAQSGVILLAEDGQILMADEAGADDARRVYVVAD